ncbi:Thiol:disulfide interchange protein [Minicystis rosea]|nr:Thiol:disulfide interchange protein [Minicystis rosea]
MPRLRIGFIALLLAACGSPAPAPVAPAAAPPIVTAAPRAVPEAPAEAPSYVMRGKLLGHDGKPMKLAHVHVGERSMQVDEGGGFRIDAPGPGFLAVRFTGVDHAELDARLHFDGRPAEIEITLGTYERRPAPFAGASVAVYLRAESGGAPVARRFPEPVKKLANGMCGVVLLEKSDEIFYALDDVARGHRVNGEAESFLWNGQSYLGQLHRRDGGFRIMLDAAKMPPAGVRPRLRFADANARGARITRLGFDADLRAEDDGMRAPGDATWRAEIAHALAGERDAEVAAALGIAYLVPRSGLGARGEEAVTIARDLLDRLPAEAPIWALAPTAAITAVELAGSTAERETYLDRVTDGLRDRDTAASFAGARLRSASRAGREAEVARLFGIMRARFAGTNATHAVAFYDPARHLRPDHEVPDFDLPALPDGARTPAGTRISRASLRDKVTLIDFWGFWCAPCIAEIGSLHDVYDRYKDAGFTIVSVAVRTKVPAIRQFRVSRFPMPWRHVVLDDANQDDTLDRFEIKSYPSPILIDRAGKVVAAGDDLRGEGLARAVAAALRAGARSGSP